MKFTSHLSARLCAAMLLCLVLLAPLTGIVRPLVSASAADAKTVLYASPAIPATVGEAVKLSDYAVQFSQTLTTAADKISWSSDVLTVTDGTVQPLSRGVFALTATAGTSKRTVYLVVKAQEETEYVLYEETFDNITSFDELGYSIVQKTNDNCTIQVKNGKLVLSAQSAADNYIRVLLPDWLSTFGNYTFECTAAMTAQQSTSRWMSFMFRVQSSNFPYYQMAVRADSTATNGTELALRTAKDAWDVQYTAGYDKKMSDKAYRTFKIAAFDKTVETSIDGTSLVYAENISSYKVGNLGLQVRACEMTVDKIRVVLRDTAPAAAPEVMADVLNPTSNVVLPASIVTNVTTAEELNALTALVEKANNGQKDVILPATAIFKAKGSQVLSGAKSYAEAIAALGGRVIPAFYVEDSATVTELMAYLTSSGYVTDALVISADASLLRSARDASAYVRVALDFSQKSPEELDLSSVRSATNASGARICILPDTMATKSNVEFLQRLLMTVWIQSTNDSIVPLMTDITSGANGIITQDYNLLGRSYTTYFSRETIVRTSAIIGHRGIPSLAQENTLQGSILAYELGATAIENDIRLTKDGVIVVMHDATIDRTTNGVGNVSDYTYEQLKKFSVDSNTDVAAQPIPTLEEYFVEFKGKDVQLIVEIKSSNKKICAPLKALIEKYDILDQVNVIAFDTAMITELKKIYPELSVGYLNSTLQDNENDPNSSVELILKTIQPLETTYNPSYNKGALGTNLLLAASHRGMTIWPWTINEKADLDKYFRYATYGVTTNYTQYVSNCLRTVTVREQEYVFSSVEEMASFEVLGYTYDRTEKVCTKLTLVFLEGDDVFSCNRDGKLEASAPGTATVMISVAASAPMGSTYRLCTQPFTITLKAPAEETTGEQDTTLESTLPQDTTASTPVEDTTAAPVGGGGCGSTVSGSAAAIVALLLIPAVLLRKKDER